ncbi:unnamed protein product [Brugia pahangi]|uniref:Uncharacterized protein n=1 Tax=Brugia pahangi TaxID=6280 RepID=A0A0N4SZV3_BRUPA|nr:unnamed protein product [Brugia pahangi]
MKYGKTVPDVVSLYELQKKNRNRQYVTQEQCHEMVLVEDNGEVSREIGTERWRKKDRTMPDVVSLHESQKSFPLCYIVRFSTVKRYKSLTSYYNQSHIHRHLRSTKH